MHYEHTFQDCYVRFDNAILTIGNQALERTWDLSGTLPTTRTLINKSSGKQWLCDGYCGEWVTWPKPNQAFFLQGVTTGGMQVVAVNSETDDDCGIAAPHLRVTVSLTFAGFAVEWIHIVYPQLSTLRSFLRAKRLGEPLLEDRAEEWMSDYCDLVPLEPMHCSWKSVTLTDKTDDNDNLVVETKGILTRRETREFQANILMVEDKACREGVILVKEGPTPVAYLTNTKTDFVAKGMELFTTGWGFSADMLAADETLESYGAAVILWDGSEEQALERLQQYNRAIRTFAPERDAQIMANTWGDGNCDGRICEAFLMQELHRASEMGISYYQIDDGWQNGTTANSVNATTQTAAVWGSGYYAADPDFWTVNRQRFPNGLEPIVDYAQKHGIALGLWFSPDALHDYAGWERDAQTLLGLHQRYGVTAFKMDGLTFHSKRGEENFGRLMRKVVTESQGKVFFNLDTTASVRNGYFGRVQYGSLFLENRFSNVFGTWPNYWPHHTLRNLWMLCRYMPAERLQIEFLNVKNNAALYNNDPLAPIQWGQELAFAISLFASPLAWMELSALEPDAVETLKNAIAAYRPVQADILRGHVLPIGEEPDGFGWTGLQSVGANKCGYLLLFRGKNDQLSHEFVLWDQMHGTLNLTPILGSTCQVRVETNDAGVARFSLDAPMSYALYRYVLKK